MLSLFRLLLLPVLLPLSIFYGAIVFLLRVLAFNKVELSSPVISVGNFCVGGSGKTPLVGELIVFLQEKGYSPVIVSKSYKADLKSPSEVLLGSDPFEYGDEAVSLKEKFTDVRVFSGPIKADTALYADGKLGLIEKKVFIVDDGAQHHKLKKDFKVHAWDVSRPLIDVFPFPLGMSREFWFLGEKPDLSVLNRSLGGLKECLLRTLICGEKLTSSYSVKEIINGESCSALNGDFVLISGLGNFNQLSKAVKDYIKDQSYKLIKEIPGKDHDDFKWFKAEINMNYVCTEKDLFKLKEKIPSENLFVVKSEFSEDFKIDFFKILSKRF